MSAEFSKGRFNFSFFSSLSLSESPSPPSSLLSTVRDLSSDERERERDSRKNGHVEVGLLSCRGSTKCSKKLKMELRRRRVEEGGGREISKFPKEGSKGFESLFLY